jgi:hypothetical protein
MLAAVALASAKKDIREYLRGVCVDGPNLIATDGHRIHVGHIGGDFTGHVVIPIDVVKDALTISKGEFVELEQLGEGWTIAGGIPFEPVAGKYPEWRRVVLGVQKPGSVPPMNGFYLHDVARAAKLLGDKRGGFAMHCEAGASSVLCKLTARDDFVALLMGQSMTDAIRKDPSNPWHSAILPGRPAWI